MCGIAGFIGDGTAADLTRMQAALVHRGPDDEGQWIDHDNGVFLGHRRLKVLDPAGGAQPMWTADHAIGIVYNGEIYNHAELRKELERDGVRFVSNHSDTEVLLYGYQRWGDAVVDRLNGMWAFAIYDEGRRRLLLSRDRFGEKPLYHACTSSAFVFASELTGILLHPSVANGINPLEVQKYFAYGFSPNPGTIYRGIYKLPAGHNLVFDLDRRSTRIQAYWRFEMNPVEPSGKARETDLEEELLELLDRAVERRLIADVPLGVLLSGGIDSSAITAAACRSRASLKTFSLGFDVPQFDESPAAGRVAGLLGTDHTVEMAQVDTARHVIGQVLQRLDEPLGDSSLIPTFMLCKMAREQVTVALSGDGGDELFAGYAPFKALRYADLYTRTVPGTLHRIIRMAIERLPVRHGYMSLDFKLKRALHALGYRPALWNPLWLGPLRPDELEECFVERYALDDIYAEAIAAWNRSSSGDLIEKTTQFYVNFYLPDGVLMKSERASMMHSLEVRAPFLDVDLVEFAARLPSRFRLRGGTAKYLLRRALARRLPADILNRRKQGFAVPIGKWIKDGVLGDDAGAAIAGQTPEFVGSTLARHRAGKIDHRLFLWCQVVLKRHLEAAQRYA